MPSDSLDYLRQLEQLFSHQDSAHSQRHFYQWQLAHAHAEKIVSYKTLPAPIVQCIEAFIRSTPPQLKGCHHTAWLLATTDDAFGVSSGTALSLIPMDHSWNFYSAPDGQKMFFDLTDEIALKGKHFSDYVSILHLKSEELLYWADKTGHSGPYLGEAFLEHLHAEQPSAPLSKKTSNRSRRS